MSERAHWDDTAADKTRRTSGSIRQRSAENWHSISLIESTAECRKTLERCGDVDVSRLAYTIGDARTVVVVVLRRGSNEHLKHRRRDVRSSSPVIDYHGQIIKRLGPHERRKRIAREEVKGT